MIFVACNFVCQLLRMTPALATIFCWESYATAGKQKFPVEHALKFAYKEKIREPLASAGKQNSILSCFNNSAYQESLASNA